MASFTSDTAGDQVPDQAAPDTDDDDDTTAKVNFCPSDIPGYQWKATPDKTVYFSDDDAEQAEDSGKVTGGVTKEQAAQAAKAQAPTDQDAASSLYPGQ